MYGFKKLYLPLLMVALVVGCGDKKDGATTEEKKSTQVAANDRQMARQMGSDTIYTNGLISSMPQSSKSLVFRVATANPWARAMPAICPSGRLMARPVSLRCPMISA